MFDRDHFLMVAKNSFAKKPQREEQKKKKQKSGEDAQVAIYIKNWHRVASLPLMGFASVGHYQLQVQLTGLRQATEARLIKPAARQRPERTVLKKTLNVGGGNTDSKQFKALFICTRNS